MRKTGITLLAIVFINTLITSCGTTKNVSTSSSTNTVPNGASPTTAYFTASVLPILVEKCNGCHAGKTGHVPIFKAEHYNNKHIIDEVHTTVFVEESMPKGKVKLTEEEKAILKYWVKTPFN